jgi:endonuclease-3 related protein
MNADRRAYLLGIYRRLLERFGPQGWWPGEGGPFEVCIGAILTQSAAWTNVEKALARLKAAGALSPWALHRTPEVEVAELVRSSGYFNAKARKVKAFAAHLCDRYDGDVRRFLARPQDELREALLGIYGIGEETADDMVLYAAGQPSFVVDAYTQRIVTRLGLKPERESYEAYRALFMEALPRDAALYNEYHALLVRLGKEVCLKREPRCEACPLRVVCETGRGRDTVDRVP